MDLMQNLFLFLLVFIIISIIHIIINLIQIKRKREILGSSYVIKKFKIDLKKIKKISMAITISIVNSFIISFVGIAITALPFHVIWQLLIGFVMLFGLIYSIYEIYGKLLVRKGWGKNEQVSKTRKK